MHATWPEIREDALIRNTMTIVVQVNGKLRGRIQVATTAEKDVILARARQEPQVAKFLIGMTEVKAVLVPQKLVNLVVKPI
tara:strand:- start:295 stop:537 length:243 start_codon:yes stop_codon:yes gene_type:complete